MYYRSRGGRPVRHRDTAREIERSSEGSSKIMGLFHYFTTNPDTMLTDPRGPLAKRIPSTRVNHVCKRRGEAAASGPANRGTDKRGSYTKFRRQRSGNEQQNTAWLPQYTLLMLRLGTNKWAWLAAIHNPRKLFP